MNRLWLTFWIAALLTHGRAVDAIVVRHDKPDADYVALGNRFPAGVAILQTDRVP